MIRKIVLCFLFVVLPVTVSLAQAQQPKKVPRIGFLSGLGGANNPQPFAFREGLSHLGWVFRALIRTLAVGPDDAGFWPVISKPSVTTWTPQFLTLE